MAVPCEDAHLRLEAARELRARVGDGGQLEPLYGNGRAAQLPLKHVARGAAAQRRAHADGGKRHAGRQRAKGRCQLQRAPAKGVQRVGEARARREGGVPRNGPQGGHKLQRATRRALGADQIVGAALQGARNNCQGGQPLVSASQGEGGFQGVHRVAAIDREKQEGKSHCKAAIGEVLQYRIVNNFCAHNVVCEQRNFCVHSKKNEEVRRFRRRRRRAVGARRAWCARRTRAVRQAAWTA